jgi:adenine phosphoribosyltransferase
MNQEDIELIKKSIRNIPDFPKPGIQFKDISTLLSNPAAFEASVYEMGDMLYDSDITFNKIAGIESRGFIFGAALAFHEFRPFVMIRKPGKLPVETVRQSYQLEYGEDSIEVAKDMIRPGDSVLLVDDLLATGGTLEAAAELVEKCGATVSGIMTVVELTGLGGRERLGKYQVMSLVSY